MFGWTIPFIFRTILYVLALRKKLCESCWGGWSLDPGNPLIVSTAPFVSISFKLMGTLSLQPCKTLASRVNCFHITPLTISLDESCPNFRKKDCFIKKQSSLWTGLVYHLTHLTKMLQHTVSFVGWETKKSNLGSKNSPSPFISHLGPTQNCHTQARLPRLGKTKTLGKNQNCQ